VVRERRRGWGFGLNGPQKPQKIGTERGRVFERLKKGKASPEYQPCTENCGSREEEK
jgi:hypothetical protein